MKEADFLNWLPKDSEAQSSFTEWLLNQCPGFGYYFTRPDVSFFFPYLTTVCQWRLRVALGSKTPWEQVRHLNQLCLERKGLPACFKVGADERNFEPPDLEKIEDLFLYCLERRVRREEYNSSDATPQQLAVAREANTVAKRVFRASPNVNQMAVDRSVEKQLARDLPALHYPGQLEAELQLALENVISEFCSWEISCEVSPDPQVFEAQHALFNAVRTLCKPVDGPKMLANFIVEFLRSWPGDPCGLEFDLDDYFSADKRRAIVHEHLGLSDGQVTKEADDFLCVLHAVIFRDELRVSLLKLAQDARLRADQRRKGWQHFRKALTAVFNHIRREPSDEGRFRDFERMNFPYMRNTNVEQRRKFFPDVSHDADKSVRDLTKKERMILAERHLKLEHPITRNEGRSGSEIRYGRAQKQVRNELGFD